MIVTKKLIAIIIFIVLITATAIVLSQQDSANNNSNNPDDNNSNDDNNNNNGSSAEKTYYALDISFQGNGTVTKKPNLSQYLENSSVTLTATPHEGWYFDHWEGDHNSTKNPAEINILQNTSITAVFIQGGYTLSIAKNGNGVLFVDTNYYDQNVSYAPGSTIELYAQGRDGYSFSHWGGDINGTENPINILIDSDKTIEAFFIEGEFSLNFKTEGNGNITATPSKQFYKPGDQVTITATADPGWYFEEWKGSFGINTQENPYTFTVEYDYTITALFIEEEYSIMTTIEGNGTVDRDPEYHDYSYGDEVSFTAYADSNWILNYWEIEATGERYSTNPLQLTITDNLNLTVNFTDPDTGYRLTTYVYPTNSTASIKKTPDQNRYSAGTQITLKAINSNNWTFSEWYGDIQSTQNPITFTLNENMTITGDFNPTGYHLNISINGEGNVSLDPNQASYANGTELTATALAEPGYRFTHWSGDLNGTENPTQLIMDSNKTIIANFEQLTYNLTIITVGNGTTTPQPGNYTHLGGTEILLSSNPQSGFDFNYWDCNGELTLSSQKRLTLTNDTTITAYFVNPQTSNKLTTQTIGEGSISREPNKNYYLAQENVTLKAQTENLWVFSEWGGDLNHTSSTAHITMDENKNISAVFLEARVLTISINGEGSTTPYSEGENLVPIGNEVLLHAQPQTGWLFESWGGDANSTENPLRITITENTSLTAHFYIQEYSLNVSIIGEGNVITSPDLSSYPHGTQVSLTVVEGPGSFVEWSGDIQNTVKILNITMTGNTDLTARFATPDLIVIGSITLNDVKPGSTINTTLRLSNVGEEDSLLSWQSSIQSNWGTWIIFPNIGEGVDYLSNEVLNITIEVPDEKNENFEAILSFTNQLDPSDSEDVIVSITTSYNRFPLLENILNYLYDFFSQFPFFEHISGLLFPNMQT